MSAAIAYIRVSTEGQATDGVSLDAQRAKIEAWCTANDYTLAMVCVDAGISGKRADNRPQLQQALDAVCEAKGVLIVYSLSRLARSTKDTITISERLDKAGADLVSLSERIDTTSAAGKMVFRMLAVLNEFERDLISERTSAAMAHKRAKGERLGTIPFGYDVAPDGVSLVRNEEQQKALLMIHKLREEGLTFRAIAAELDSRGIAPKTGKGAWHFGTIAQILKRPGHQEL